MKVYLDRSEGLAARGYFIPGGASQTGGGQALAFCDARCQTWSRVGPKTGRKLTKISYKLSKSAKVNMLKSGDVSFDFSFELCLPTGYVGNISMPEPMLSLSMLILAKSGQSKSKSWLTKVPVRSKNHQIRPEMDRESTVWPETKTK